MTGGSESTGGGAVRAVCVFGLGEAGSLLARDLVAAGIIVTAYDPAEVATPPGVRRRVHPALAVRSAPLILALTPGAEARLALLQALDAIEPGTLYADLGTAGPALKNELAEIAHQRELDFADVAMMGMVPGLGLTVPALAAGPGAARLAELLNPVGARIQLVDGPAGSAVAKKLLRSVMMKGTGAVLVEAVRAGAGADDLAWLWDNLVDEIAGADEEWMRRLVEGSKTHARRRHHEMQSAVDMLDRLGVEPIMTRATVASLADLEAGGQIPDLPDR